MSVNRKTDIREDVYHQAFKRELENLGLKENVDFLQYVTSNPDYIFINHSILGEVKKNGSTTSYKDAFKEIKNREGKQYDIKNYDNFFILTDKHISVYRTNDIDWSKNNFTQEDFDKFVTRFNNTPTDIKALWEYIKNKCEKIYVESDIASVLDMLLEEKYHLTVQDALYILLHLDSKVDYSSKNNLLIFNLGQDDEYDIDDITKEDYVYIRKNIIDKYKLRDAEEVKEYIRHNYSSHLNDTKKSNLGKYYTPKELVQLVYDLISDKIGENDYVMDLCCGCGAFMTIFDEFNLIGRDVDKNAIGVLELLQYKNVAIDNSLFNVSRDKYGLKDTDKICIIGNPPYNDTTSKNKRFGTNAKTETGTEIDADIKTNDLGRSFLKAYAKLSPEYICVLHPLAYLIKEQNFKSLDKFNKEYKLIDGVIFQSSLFNDLIGSSEFPVIAALYGKGTMDYDYIKDFNFKIFKSEKTFTLKNFTTIDNLPEASWTSDSGKKAKNRFKYPRKIDDHHILKSDINLYQYNIRDTNSLMSSGNIMALANNDNMNYCTIFYDELPYFSYIHNYRNFMQNDYLIGNLSPLVNPEDMKKEEFLDLMVIATILTDMHRIPIFNVDDSKSIVYTKFIKNKCERKSKSYNPSVNEYPNFYKMFLDFIEDKENREKHKNDILQIVLKYFLNLKNSFFK